MNPVQNIFYLYLLVLCKYRSEQTAASAFSWISNRNLQRYPFPCILDSKRSLSRIATQFYSTVQQQDEGNASAVSSSETILQSPVGQITKQDDEEEEDGDEWEYQEYEILQESDFYDSEWKVGTLWDNNPNTIDTTWCRLVLKDDQNVAIWGDGAVGKWSFDVPSQFLGISKETFGGWFGKQIWAGVVDDYYFMQGTVRGWSPISPASVLAQWQAKRLGVSGEEAGVAPWFQEDDDDNTTEKNIEDSTR